MPLLGSTRGFYVTASEVTQQRISERRMETLLRLGECHVATTDMHAFWKSALDGLSPNEHDIPLALAYSVVEDNFSDGSPSLCAEYTCRKICFLEGALGIPEGHNAAPHRLELSSGEGLAPYFRDVIRSGKPIHLCSADGTLPELLLHGFKTRGFGDICNGVIICPIRATHGDNITAILMLGLNPRLKYDDEYSKWISLLVSSLANKAASISLLQGKIRSSLHDVEQAARNQAELASELEIRTREASDIAKAFARFQLTAEIVTVGMFEFLPNGKLLQANEIWFELSGHPRDPALSTEFSFMKYVYGDDIQLVTDNWLTLARGIPVTFEMRWKKFRDVDGVMKIEVEPTWILAAWVPVTDEDGTLLRISGCTTDITAQKQSAQVAMERANALERARASELRFVRFAELAPVAIYILNANKELTYCNDKWFEMTKSPHCNYEDIVWQSFILTEDLGIVGSAWDIIATQKIPQTFQFRFAHLWSSTDGTSCQAWCMTSAYPELASDGSIESVVGTMIDISQFKWAENVQMLRIEEALEAKRQQENFIDMISHEMRNPLSAVVQCADMIAASISQIAIISDSLALSRNPLAGDHLKQLIQDSAESIQTIIACSIHQKRIVDDVLTLSKLDTSLLVITPVDVQPLKFIKDAAKMFDVESKSANVRLHFKKDISVDDMAIDWVKMDPSRVLQVLINFLTNAIKFTHSETTREVTLSMKASKEKPSKYPGVLEYIPLKTKRQDPTTLPDWGNGEVLFLQFTVQDTGRGLNLGEKEKLFKRFSQASPRTHVQYGGSGLGLFISRELTELQGGEIAFWSEKAVGSIFTFYVKCRRTTSPLLLRNMGSPRRDSGIHFTNGTKGSNGNTQLNVLIVEDNLINQQLLKKQLKALHCEVHVACDGLEALDMIKATRHWHSQQRSAPCLSIVLMDIEMPVMDGLTCIRKIREYEKIGYIIDHLPVIAVTANVRRDHIMNSIKAGMDDVIGKPFRIPDLMVKIGDLLMKEKSRIEMDIEMR